MKFAATLLIAATANASQWWDEGSQQIDNSWSNQSWKPDNSWSNQDWKPDNSWASQKPPRPEYEPRQSRHQQWEQPAPQEPPQQPEWEKHNHWDHPAPEYPPQQQWNQNPWQQPEQKPEQKPKQAPHEHWGNQHHQQYEHPAYPHHEPHFNHYDPLSKLEHTVETLKQDLEALQEQVDGIQCTLPILDFYSTNVMDIDYARGSNTLYGEFCVEAGKSVEMQVQVSADATYSDAIFACIRIIRSGETVAEGCEDDDKDPSSLSVFYSATIEEDESFAVELYADRRPGEIGELEAQFGLKIYDECYEVTNVLPDNDCDNGLDELLPEPAEMVPEQMDETPQPHEHPNHHYVPQYQPQYHQYSAHPEHGQQQWGAPQHQQGWAHPQQWDGPSQHEHPQNNWW